MSRLVQYYRSELPFPWSGRAFSPLQKFYAVYLRLYPRETRGNLWAFVHSFICAIQFILCYWLHNYLAHILKKKVQSQKVGLSEPP